jgi:DNA polymerase IV
MRLNQHGLFKDVIEGKGRVKITEGELVEAHNELMIFEIPGVPYRPPEHRNC